MSAQLPWSVYPGRCGSGVITADEIMASRMLVFMSTATFVGISAHLIYNVKRTVIDGKEPIGLKIDRGFDPVRETKVTEHASSKRS